MYDQQRIINSTNCVIPSMKLASSQCGGMLRRQTLSNDFKRLGVEPGSGHSFARETSIRHITISDRSGLLQRLIRNR